MQEMQGKSEILTESGSMTELPVVLQACTLSTSHFNNLSVETNNI